MGNTRRYFIVAISAEDVIEDALPTARCQSQRNLIEIGVGSLYESGVWRKRVASGKGRQKGKTLDRCAYRELQADG